MQGFPSEHDVPRSPAAPPLNYRTLIPGGQRVERVLRELAISEAIGVTAAAAKLTLGLPLCLVGPAFVALIVRAIEIRWDWRDAPGFLPTFLVMAAILVPLLLYLERRTRGQFLADALQGQSDPLGASSYGEFCVQGDRFLWTFYTEIALQGPRLVWAFVDCLRGRPMVDPATRTQAAQIVIKLYDTGHGQPLRNLVEPGLSQGEVLNAVRYLVSRDWAGLSSRRDRVWLSSRTREHLKRLLQTPAHGE